MLLVVSFCNPLDEKARYTDNQQPSIFAKKAEHLTGRVKHKVDNYTKEARQNVCHFLAKCLIKAAANGVSNHLYALSLYERQLRMANGKENSCDG